MSRDQGHASNGKTALVIDDGAVERLAGKAFLEKLGFLVRTAASGEEALALLAQEPAMLVLCDVSMPGISGLDVLAVTRTFSRPPLTVMVTSHGDKEFAESAMRAGAAAYLEKPLRFDALRSTVEAAMARAG
jgi:CheY-like chemotaxis protein